MTVGQFSTANATIASNGANNFTVSDFTTVDGTSLGTSDVVVVHSYIHNNNVTVNRTGDPDSDSTFEINVSIESRTGAGERSGVSHIVSNVAGLEVSETSGNEQEVTLIGKRIDASRAFVEQSAGVTDTNEIARTTGSRGQAETVYEFVVSSGDASLIRRHDANDDGVFEMNDAIETISAEVSREKDVLLTDESGRTNPEMELALQASGGSRDLMLFGTIGMEV